MAHDRFSVWRDDLCTRRKGQHPLVPGFAASADPAVSFDGQRVLFAGKVEGGGSLADLGDRFRGRSTATRHLGLRRLCSAALSARGSRGVCAQDRRAIRGRDRGLAGGKPLALDVWPANFLPTDVLRDGRILFEAAYPLGTETVPEIYTVYSDGSGVESYRCDHGTARHSGRQVGSGDVVFASGHGLARFTSARAQEVQHLCASRRIRRRRRRDLFGRLALVLACRTRTSLSADAVDSRFDCAAPRVVEEKVVVEKADSDAVQPALLREHPVPNRHPSGLHDWPNANLLCLNAYTSKYQFAAGIDSLRAPLHARQLRRSQIARHRARRARRIVLRSGAHRAAFADRTAGCRRQNSEARSGILLDAARRAAWMRGMPRWPGNFAGECGSHDPAEVHHSGRHDWRDRAERFGRTLA